MKKGKKKEAPRAMFKVDGNWCIYRFEFDAGDGLRWQQGRSCGPNENIEKCTRHFQKKGYTVIDWRDV